MSEAGSYHFTGERPGWGQEFDYDEARSLAAYRYAARLAAGKRVADAGCGEGFGTQSLADVAVSVVGFDYSRKAIAFCRRTWNRPNLSFREIDLTRLEAVSERFDLVVNFQVLEHMRDDRGFLEALRRLVAPGGQLLLSTPNRLKSFSENPYHVREYTAQELAVLLEQVFQHVQLLGMHGNELVERFDRRRERAVKQILRLDPLGIRKVLPATCVTFAFAQLARLVRRRAHASADERALAPADFRVRDDKLNDALDLVALCEA